MHRAILALVALVVSLPALASPPEALAKALRHARSLPPDTSRKLRYLDLTHLSPEQRAEAFRVISFHLNALSTEPDIIRPQQIDGGTLLAFDLRDYGIDPYVYGRLSLPEAAEPYYHAVAEAVDEKGKKFRYSVPAPWLDQAAYTELSERLGGSQVPILRGDWFFTQTAVQKDRVAGYYDLLGLGKKSADFQKLIGANAAEAKRLKLEMAANVSRSIVALHNRGITRLQSLTGGYWLTLDYKTSVNKQNTARLLAGDTEPPQGDASEQYGVLPNKLFAFWLEDAQGNRQDTAPDFIASDGRSTSPDRRVHVGLSCIRCHVEGLRPVDDYTRRLFSNPIFLVSPDYEKLKRLRQLYLSDLAGQLADDNARYAQAVKAANGCTPAENANLYGAFWQAYVDTPVTVEMAAAELGSTKEAFVTKVRAYVQRAQLVDPVVAAFAQEPPLSVRREHFEEVFHIMWQVAGVKP